ncbi:flavodoxin family protein [Sulfitobacter sabulilitoris]|uniref:Flavodoxin family protein n=1 Tax=Sulfitobacter sabulilitoris TaxID=2562655 RepID=A0A5S3PBY6_9RHOB|nr:flavodoxin family protein [Sulfitobacter sabulilitoris]TMM51210.1 flavodoxin family protein [Sulfitobacter sabulilitoris]
MLQTVKTTAVVYYSRTGHSKDAATEIADTLGAQRFRLTVDRYHGPRLGYLTAGFDSLRQRLPQLTSPQPALRGFQAIVFCAPVWTSYPATPMRRFLRDHPVLPGVVGLFLTCGDDSEPAKAFEMAQADLGRSFQARGYLPDALARTPGGQQRVTEFCAALQALVKTAV